MLLSVFLLALRSVRRNLLRSFLTILGIVIGVSAVITMVTLGNGATQSIRNQIAGLGSNLLLVMPGQRLPGGGGGGGGGVPQFTPADAEAIASQIGGVAAVAPQARAAATVVANGRNWSTSVTGSTNAWFEVGNWKLAQGRIFEPDEQTAGAAVCVVGETVRRELFGGTVQAGASAPPGLGQALRIKQFSCTIVGILAAKGQSGMGDQDDAVIVPLQTLQRRVSGNRRVNTISVAMAEASDSAPLKASLRSLLRERRKLAPADDDNFSIFDTQQLAETLSGTMGVMTTLLGAVAAVSLLVGGIGIMNIMLVSVTERTREIGLRLAVGALEREVLLQFLIESVVLSALGGLVGIAIATVASWGLSALMDVPYAFDPGINLLSLLFSAAIGVLFGYFPARRAARMDPIEALRHE
ncbi:ABC transporter permease [Pseudaquabacterium pictum]|uniref:ABC transporter permease n=1 Tax=Pseudaquabacterium pictum TaxID=2315236 RepID=A0A480AMG8_9BURK|nr:ABC transporter permease [Rubrivivax pictus]GCL62206.1 ABC transporter permease [Rubrivivax pictus]